MLKYYAFLLSPEHLPSGGCRLTCSQTHASTTHAIHPVEAPTAEQAVRIAATQLEELVKLYLGWERRRISLDPYIRKTSFGSYHVVFEVDID